MEDRRADYRISPFLAEFADAGVELAFREAAHPARVRDTRFAIIVAALFYVAFAFTDYLVLGASEEYQVVFMTRLVVGGLAILVAMSAGRFWRALMDGITPTLVEGMAMTGFLSITLLRPFEIGWHGMSLMVMLMGIYAFIPNRFPHAMVVSLGTTVAFLWLVNQHFEPEPRHLLTLTLLLFAVNLFGALTAYRFSRSMREEYRDAEVLRQANEQLSREIQQRQRLEAELRLLAHRDDLTGIANRRHFLEQSGRAFSRARRTGEALSLLIFDIDYFKQINDTYGHGHGDEVLKALVAVCQRVLRADDLLARLGGEEFAALLPDRDIAAALDLAENLRAEMQRTPVRLVDTTLYFTVSIGVAEWQSGESIEMLARRGDEALYLAKFNGRNRVERARSQAQWGMLEPGREARQNEGSRHETHQIPECP